MANHSILDNNKKKGRKGKKGKMEKKGKKEIKGEKREKICKYADTRIVTKIWLFFVW